MTSRSALARRRALVASFLATLLLAGLMAFQAAEPASAACAANGGRRLAGTVQGEDGRYVWSLIGVVLFDSAGRRIKIDGCPEPDDAAYAAVVKVNEHLVDGHGATSGAGLTKSWEVRNIPSNAATVWLEAYPMTDERANPQPISRVRYGHAMRRGVPLPNTSINLRLPLRCTAGGSTGTISGRSVVNGRPVRPDWVWAWNEDPDTGSKIMGWGMAEVRNGWYRLENLASNQTYVVWANYGGNIKVFNGLRVDACRDTRLDIVQGAGIPDTDAIAGLDDVKLGTYYAPAAAWALSRGITTGVGGTRRFAPHEAVTRGQMVTFLWRTAGQPAASRNSGFVDVPTNSYYAPAVTWARQRGITTGVGGTNRFEPNRPVTRAELATFLWRAEGSPSASTNSGFIDVPRNTYYARAVTWARDRGVTTGVGGTNRFEPARWVTRGEMIAMLWRSEGNPAHGKPPVRATQTCASFSSHAKAKQFRTMYAPWGDIANLGSRQNPCPLIHGAPQ